MNKKLALDNLLMPPGKTILQKKKTSKIGISQEQKPVFRLKNIFHTFSNAFFWYNKKQTKALKRFQTRKIDSMFSEILTNTTVGLIEKGLLPGKCLVAGIHPIWKLEGYTDDWAECTCNLYTLL